jgi:hypothetical protein
MNDPKEWSDIKGYEGLYQIRMIDKEPWVEIKSLFRRKRELKFEKSSKGYHVVQLYKKDQPYRRHQKKVHRLVAMQYIPNIENKATVNHKNGIKTDNRIENLEWNTILENHRHARENGLIDNTGEKNYNFKGKIGVYKDGVLIDTITGRKEMVLKGWGKTHVYRVLKGEMKSYKGHTFERMENPYM